MAGSSCKTNKTELICDLEFLTEKPPVDRVLKEVVIESKIGMPAKYRHAINIRERAM